MKENINLESDLFPIYKPLPPFIKFPMGYGYMGVIMQSSRTGKIQCHLCGKLFKSVGRHVSHAHDMSGEEYKELIGLNKFTPLVCENTSSKMRENYIMLPSAEKEKKIETLRKNNYKLHHGGNYVKKIKGEKCRLQMNNKFGTCELQAKHYFWEEYKKLGRIPTYKDMTPRLKWLVHSRFNSYDEALVRWGIDENEIAAKKLIGKQNAVEARRKNNFFPKYNKNKLILSIIDYYKKNDRLPTWEESRRIGFPHRSVWKRLLGTNIKKELDIKFKQLVFN